MSRIKILLLSLLALWAVSSMVSASASAAELQGPWWMKSEGGKQVKIEQEKELQIKSDNFNGQAQIPFRVISQNNKVLECKVVTNKGWLWDGNQAHQGLNEEEIKFFECTFTEPGCPARATNVGQAKVRTELMWKYQGVKKELEEQGQQKIFDVFAPSETPKQYKVLGGEKAKFFKITVAPGGGCVEKVYNLWATGSSSTWENQQHTKFPVVWGTAAQVEPQNLDRPFVILNWSRPNTKQLHHKTEPQTATLALAEENQAEATWEGAEIQAQLALEEEFGLTEFGAWDET